MKSKIRKELKPELLLKPVYLLYNRLIFNNMSGEYYEHLDTPKIELAGVTLGFLGGRTHRCHLQE